MGNCMVGGFAGVDQVIKVVTSNGGVMELYTPVTVQRITDEFPGQAIYHKDDVFTRRPLPNNEELHAGEMYYLLPLIAQQGCNEREEGYPMNGVVVAPYRMSSDNNGIWKRVESEVFSRCNKKGIWKVKLAISPDKLTEILSQEAPTEALIETVRTVAKCGSGSFSSLSSDQWSLASSSRKGSLEHLA
ncbi:hypothetical protein MRB53_019483 [Persea americana]|uniref:Uncharacterized protein n=1 Tax=Persea americana TaxID=3435 RepID=A0ACC2KYE2_PERAE|nr:hypothetical protein MRB53_019483 [Persea americana]